MPSPLIVTHLQAICQCKHLDDLKMMDVLTGIRIVPEVFARISNAQIKSEDSGWVIPRKHSHSGRCECFNTCV